MNHPDQIARIEQLNKTKELLNKIKDYDPMPEIGNQKVKVKRLHKDAIIPTKNNLSDAGWDLYALEDANILSGSRATISTGISLQIPSEWVGLIWPRSGLSVKKGLDILAGVIDSGYRGEIKVCLQNTNVGLPLFREYDIDIQINKGDRIAQILFQKVPDVELIEVDNLTPSDRGKDGFGSSGK